MTATDHRPKLLVILWFLLVSVLCALTVEAATLCRDRRLDAQTAVGSGVSLSALCYPNGSAGYTWFRTDDLVDRIQIEYQCYTNDTELNPQVVVDWSDIFDGSRVADGIWDENTTCTFYGCYETKIFEKFWIQSTNCIPQFPVEITAGPADTTAEYLSNVSLSCTARGPPVPEFTWTVDSGSGAEDVMESEQITIATVPTGTPDEHMSILTFIDLQPSTANYTCHVNNLLGNDSSTAILNIQAPAAITAGPADITTEYLSNVSLSCTAWGAPVPDFSWTVDSGSGAEDVMESEQINVIIVPTGTPNEQMSILTLVSVEPSIANYTCHVSNLLGNDSSVAVLNVQEIVPSTTVTTTRSLLDNSPSPTGPSPEESPQLGTGNLIAIALGASIIIVGTIGGIIFISFQCYNKVQKSATINIEKAYVFLAPYQDSVDRNFCPVDPLPRSTLEIEAEKFTQLCSEDDTEVPQNVYECVEEHVYECVEGREDIIPTQVEQSNLVEEKDNSYCEPANSEIYTNEQDVTGTCESTSGAELERYTEGPRNLVPSSGGYVVELPFDSDTSVSGSGSTVSTLLT